MPCCRTIPRLLSREIPKIPLDPHCACRCPRKTVDSYVFYVYTEMPGWEGIWPRSLTRAGGLAVNPLQKQPGGPQLGSADSSSRRMQSVLEAAGPGG